MSVNFKLIGTRICEIRKSKGITQMELAEMVDVSEGYISLIEHGKKKVSLTCLIKIALVLDSSVDDFLIGNQKKSKLDYQAELEELFADCSIHEKRIIFETITELKKSIRRNRD